MRALLRLESTAREQLIDVTRQVSDLVAQSAVRDGIVVLYAQGATAAMMIQENWDDSVPRDVLSLLRRLIPKGLWQHDQQTGMGMRI